MNEMIGAVVALVIIAAIAYIGLGLVEMTYTQVAATTANDTYLDAFRVDIGTVFDTLGGMLPILVLALVGGLAIFYILKYLAGSTKE
jgi:ABC-type multidrug transport system permease subunit